MRMQETEIYLEAFHETVRILSALHHVHMVHIILLRRKQMHFQGMKTNI